MTEPTRPLADGQLAEADLAAGLESVPEPATTLWLVHGVPQPPEAAVLPRRLLAEVRRLTAELSLDGRPLSTEALSSLPAARRAVLEECFADELARGASLCVGDDLALTLLALWRGLAGPGLRVLVGVCPLPTPPRARSERPEVALAHEEQALRALLLEGAGSDVEILALDPAPGAADWEAFPPELLALHALVRGLAGRHRDFAPPTPGPESHSGAALLALSADLTQAATAIDYLASRLEPVLRTEVERTPLRGPGVEGGREEEIVEPTEDSRYPLDAGQDRAAYHRWLAARREPAVLGGGPPGRHRAATRAPRGAPLVSFLVPVFRTEPRWVLERCVASVLAQRHAGWELCLVDDGSGDPELTAYLESLPRLDRRVKVGALATSSGISAATNAALALASGRFIGFLDHDDELSPDAVARVAAALETEPEADLLYSDEDKIDELGGRFDPFFKPAWSPDLLLSYAYTCHLSVLRRGLLDELGGLRSAFDGSQDYDLALRTSERARRIVHLPEILYHWRSLPSSAASGATAKPWAYEAGRLAIADAMERRGEPSEVTEHPDFPGRYHVRRRVQGRPLVSAIIPFRDEPGLLATCAESLREAPGYDRLELVLVDNGSELPETEALLAELGRQPDVRIVRDPGPFNWAAINNAAAREASGNLLLFMNNDMEARVPGWLDALVGHALRPEIGAVGARLVYPDGAIQHAGVVIGLGGIAGHVLRGLPGALPGYASMAISTRNCSVVTGACMMVRREVFEAVGGFDEELPVAFNDVDFCLKLRAAGYLVVYTPLAELIHHESRSRGHTDDLAENQRIRERWGEALVAGDPYLNPHLSHWRYWCPLSSAQEDYRWKVYLETPPQPLDSLTST
ncbi:MAG TPA: glycosyltransferase [Acidimicrobiales bacterium]|nr:glycosyltransferase [Acidimicrobiales bacterium]